MFRWSREYIVVNRRTLVGVCFMCTLLGCFGARAFGQGIKLSNGYEWPGNGIEVYCSYYQPLQENTTTSGGQVYKWFTPSGDPYEGADAAWLAPVATAYARNTVPGGHSLIATYVQDAIAPATGDAGTGVGAQQWLWIEPYSSAYTLDMVGGGTIDAFNHWAIKTGNGEPMEPKVCSTELGTAFVQAAGTIRFYIIANRVWHRASGGSTWTQTVNSTINSQGAFLFMEFAARQPSRGGGGGGGGADPYTAMLADAFGAEDYGGGALGTAIMESRDYLYVNNLVLSTMGTNVASLLTSSGVTNSHLVAIHGTLAEWKSLEQAQWVTVNGHFTALRNYVDEVEGLLAAGNADRQAIATTLNSWYGDWLEAGIGELGGILSGMADELAGFRTDTGVALGEIYTELDFAHGTLYESHLELMSMRATMIAWYGDWLESSGEVGELDDILDTINANMNAGFGLVVERLDLIRADTAQIRLDTTNMRTTLSAIYEVLASILARLNSPTVMPLADADPEFPDPDKDDMHTRLAELEVPVNQLVLNAPDPQTSWTVDLGAVGFGGGTFDLPAMSVDLTFFSAIRPVFSMVLIGMAMAWAAGMIWEEVRRY